MGRTEQFAPVRVDEPAAAAGAIVALNLYRQESGLLLGRMP
jgi:hypothetical protein